TTSQLNRGNHRLLLQTGSTCCARSTMTTEKNTRYYLSTRALQAMRRPTQAGHFLHSKRTPARWRLLDFGDCLWGRRNEVDFGICAAFERLGFLTFASAVA